MSRFALCLAVLFLCFGCHHSTTTTQPVDTNLQAFDTLQSKVGVPAADVGPPGAVCGNGICENGPWPPNDPNDMQPECYTCPLDCAINAPANPGPRGWDTNTHWCAPIFCGNHICNADECDQGSPRYCPQDCGQPGVDYDFIPATGKCQWKHGACGDGWCENGVAGDECVAQAGLTNPPPNGAHPCLADCPRCNNPPPGNGKTCYRRVNLPGLSYQCQWTF